MKDLKFIISLLVPFVVTVPCSILLFFKIGSPRLLAVLIIFSTLASNYKETIGTISKIRKRRKKRERVKKCNEVLSNFQTFFVKNFIEFPENIQPRENLIEYVREVILPDSIFFDLFLLYLKEREPIKLDFKEKDHLARGLKERIKEFNLRNPNERDTKLGWGFYNIFCKKNKNFELEGVDKSDFFEDDCFKEKFIRKYVSKERFISEITSQKESLKDYNETLTRLYRMGKLNKFGIHKIISSIDEEKLERVLMDKIHYFILWNGFYDSFEEKVYESLTEKRREVYRGHFSLREKLKDRREEGHLTLFLVILGEDIKIQRFYEEYLEEIYNNTKKNGWLSIHKAKFEGEYVYKEKFGSSPPTEGMKKALSAKNALVTGQKIIKIDIKQRLIDSYLTPEQLLTVLPLNLFLPNINSKKKEILIENNEDIKKEFGISKLTDWANTTAKTEEIAKYLEENHFESDEVGFWVKKVRKIKKKASEIQEALEQ